MFFPMGIWVAFGLPKTLTLTVTEPLDVERRDLGMQVSTKLYEQGKLSPGQAAEIAGLTKRTFAEVMARFAVSTFNIAPGPQKNHVPQ